MSKANSSGLDRDVHITDSDVGVSRHPDTSTSSHRDSSPAPASATTLNSHKRSSFLGRALSKQNKDAARHFFSSYFLPLMLYSNTLSPQLL